MLRQGLDLRAGAIEHTIAWGCLPHNSLKYTFLHMAVGPLRITTPNEINRIACKILWRVHSKSAANWNEID